MVSYKKFRIPYEDLVIIEAQRKKIRTVIPIEAQLEQMAEECCELSQALLKKARKLRNENFTPKTLDEINQNIIEEYTDVILCAETLGLDIDKNIYKAKISRWIDRNMQFTSTKSSLKK